MPRIAGVDLPRKKQIRIALTYIYGIGRATAEEICQRARTERIGCEITGNGYRLKKRAKSVKN